MLSLLLSLAWADPCGMVPPIATPVNVPGIERTGIQRTYVMHSNGVETMVLRPGFTGSVEDFGMLIPFPSPPALRKIEDDTFQHIEAAVDPPEITVELYEPYDHVLEMSSADRPMAAGGSERREQGVKLRKDEVRVLNQEAVGMYQVAVLEAGSANALKKWMDQNGYRFPEGMDEVTNEYIGESWCFVAIKAAVGAAAGVTPEPGMRRTSTDKKGASFDGHVQGMGFRFRTPEPVVPMRLSVFNGEDPHNVVYMLTDQPVKITGMKEDLVLRQLPGGQVHRNLTEPLRVSYLNGSANDLRPQDMESLQATRDPAAYNRIARDLFSADLLAVRTGQLNLPFEEEEKELLRVSEAFGMRGADADTLHNGVIAEQRGIAVDGALDDVKEMHLTVIDGVLDGELLAAENLRFEGYKMASDRNRKRSDPLRPPDLYLSYPKRGR